MSADSRRLSSSSTRRTVVVVIGALASIVVGMLRSFYHPDIPTFQPQEVSNLSKGLTVVVTGANSGLGYETVKQLVGASTTDGGPSCIVMACRSRSRCEAAKERVLKEAGVINENASNESLSLSTTILTIQLDLEKRDSIERFAHELPTALNTAMASSTPSAGHTENATTTQDVSIDVLINNAGVFTRSPTGVFYHDESGLDEHILVNHLGHVLLMHHLWPKLLQDKTRVVAISSISALIPIDTTDEWTAASPGPWTTILKFLYPSLIRRIMAGMVSYGRSKRANMLFAHELHRRYSQFGIEAVAAHPGFASTAIWTQGGKIFPSLLSNFLQNGILTHSSSAGAATQVWAALDRVNVPSGWYVGPRWWFKGAPVMLGPIVGSAEDKSQQHYLASPHYWPFYKSDGEKLFDQSMEVLGIEEFGQNQMAAD